jgi:hypothetical protein
MFAPLLEPGDARNGIVHLLDPDGNYRSFALRVGQFMADIPEICRQLGELTHHIDVFHMFVMDCLHRSAGFCADSLSMLPMYVPIRQIGRFHHQIPVALYRTH